MSSPPGTLKGGEVADSVFDICCNYAGKQNVRVQVQAFKALGSLFTRCVRNTVARSCFSCFQLSRNIS